MRCKRCACKRIDSSVLLTWRLMVWNGDASCHCRRASFGVEAITTTVLVLLLQRSISVQGALNGVATSTVETEGLPDLTRVVFADILGSSLLASSCAHASASCLYT